MVSEQIIYAFGWAPWSSIIAGVVTALAISVILGILGVALGFTVLTPKSDDPASGLGIAFGVWGAMSVIISMAAGGFMAGLLAGQRGLEVGFLVWALATLASACVSSIAIGAFLSSIGSAVRSIGNSAAHTVAGLGKGLGRGVSHAASDLVDELKEHVKVDFDANKISGHFADILRDTGVETLQPDYLREQLWKARSEFRALLHRLAMHPTEYESLITEFLGKSKNQFALMTQGLDKGAAVNALMQARNLPKEEAETLVNNALDYYEKAVAKARETVADVRTQVEEAKEKFDHLKIKAREKADAFTSAAAKAAMAAALALIIAAGIAMGSGHLGSKYSPAWPVAGQVQSTSIVR